MAAEAESDQWPWSREHIGPPAGPSINWQIHGNTTAGLDRTGSLYMNYFDAPQKAFFGSFEKYKAAGDKHWIDFWGKLQAGPFNTECLAKPGAHRLPTGNDCTKVGQQLPPVYD